MNLLVLTETSRRCLMCVGKHFSSEAVVPRYSVKKLFLETSQNSQENTCARGSFLIKFQAEACTDLARVFSC